MSSFISVTEITGMTLSLKEPAELDIATASAQEHLVLPLSQYIGITSTSEAQELLKIHGCPQLVLELLD